MNTNDPTRKTKNPLLVAAGSGFPYENFGENALLMPVTPATPAVLRDDTVPIAELDNFIGQSPPTFAPPQHAEATGEKLNYQVDNPTTKDLPAPQQKQGYFTSILSSLPNLSLSSITGDNSKQQIQEPPPSNPPITNPYSYAYPPGPQSVPPLSSVTPNIYDPRGETIDPQGLTDVNLSPSVPPQQPPPAAYPPSGGPGSYRLGNQRRLKYAPPPNLTSTNTPPQHYSPSVPAFPQGQQQTNQPTSSPSFFIPTTPPSQQQLDAQSPPGIPSNGTSPGHSLQNSFRSSPIAPPPPPTVYTPPTTTPQAPSVFGPRDVSISNPASLATAPQAIPCRFPETATPQNTPADFAFSSFSAFREQQAVQTNSPFAVETPKKIISHVNPEVQAITAGFDISTNTQAVGQRFSPILAAKVTEKLNHLIAEQEEDSTDDKAIVSQSNEVLDVSQPSIFTPSVEEKSPEVSTDCLREEELTDVDLNSSGSEVVNTRTSFPNTPTLLRTSTNVHSEVTYLPVSNEPSFTIIPASSFFLDTSAPKTVVNPPPNKTDLEFPSLYNPSSFPQQPIPGISSSFQQTFPDPYQQPRQPTITPARTPQAIFNEASPTSIGQPETNKPVPSPVPSTFWSPHQPHPAILNPLYGSAPSRNLNFYNPTQYPNTNQTDFQPTIANAFSSNIGGGERSTIDFADVSLPESTGSAILNPIQMSVTPGVNRSTIETVPPSLQNLAAGMPEVQYRAVYQHWFYRKEVETKILWLPFSMHDSLNLEKIHNSNEINPETKVATDGGRYDVNILRRERNSVYWPGDSAEVRRCSWFYKGSTESRYVPYEESISARLEEEYKNSCSSSNWNKRIELNNGEYIVFHSPTVQVHYLQSSPPEAASSWANSSGSEDSANFQGAAGRPRVIKRGVDEFNIDDGEPEKVDHLLFLVHGIGSVCDLKFRTVEEVVDEFRSISLQLVQSHYRTASEQGIVNRIEVLPISWHTTLHSEDTGIDKKLQAITLESIPKLRHFTNDTLLDILFYTSPIYCQTIMQTVGNEMNRLFTLFNERNSDFKGNVYLGGHSLGSLILFDLLCHQKPPTEEKSEENGHIDLQNEPTNAQDNVGAIIPPVMKRKLSKKVSYVMGSAGTGQPYINYPQLAFHPQAFFALGSPIGMFVTVRGIDTLGEDFVLPTCPAFFNVFHPFDPVAYRVESLINPDAHKYRPMLIPHHKGRKRMHLELKETMARVGADLKQKLLDSVRSTWNSVYQLAVFHKQDNKALEMEIDKVVEEQMKPPPNPVEQHANDDGGADLKIGKLNGGRRIDYVLQEAPFEYINDYLFALTSHVCYWESEDTMLMMLKEIYGSMGIQTDAQLPQQSLTFERVSPASPSPSNWPSTASSPTPLVGADPTAPISSKPVGPPPTFGFMRKS